MDSLILIHQLKPTSGFMESDSLLDINLQERTACQHPRSLLVG